MGMVLSQIVGLIFGVGACWVFWRWQLRVKPKVRLANRAVFCKTSGCLGVKAANLGKHQATDVEARMAVADRTREGRIITKVPGRLNASTLVALEPLPKLSEPWHLPTVFVFAAMNGDEMMRCLREDHQNGADRRLLFTLTMRDGLSGTKVVETTAYRPEEIDAGWYGPALSFESNPNLVYEPSIETGYATIS